MYQPISAVAASLQITEHKLLDFQRKGWIQAVSRNGLLFLASDQSYRAKYILHLYESKHLNDEQIQVVLSIQRPPYSAADVDQILREHEPVSNSQDAGS